MMCQLQEKKTKAKVLFDNSVLPYLIDFQKGGNYGNCNDSIAFFKTVKVVFLQFKSVKIG